VGECNKLTTVANLAIRSSQEDLYWSGTDDILSQSDGFVQSRSTVHSQPNRYITQRRSGNGKLTYVVFAGHDIGVFYNWYVDYQCLTTLNKQCYRSMCSAAMISFSNKVYKGYATYSEAHQVWGAFVNHNTLPPDILNGLYSRPRPLPPTLPRPDIRGLAKPSSPTPLQPSPTPLQALAATGHPLRPISTLFAHHPEAFGMPSAYNVIMRT
jgi:hypothetical protein